MAWHISYEQMQQDFALSIVMEVRNVFFYVRTVNPKSLPVVTLIVDL